MDERVLNIKRTLTTVTRGDWLPENHFSLLSLKRKGIHPGYEHDEVTENCSESKAEWFDKHEIKI